MSSSRRTAPQGADGHLKQAHPDDQGRCDGRRVIVALVFALLVDVAGHFIRAESLETLSEKVGRHVELIE